jgi:hypothetical protein
MNLVEQPSMAAVSAPHCPVVATAQQIRLAFTTSSPTSTDSCPRPSLQLLKVSPELTRVYLDMIYTDSKPLA